jgi:NMD protein affecting ribosome stability and mRNA decay
MIICEECDAEIKIKIMNELPVKFCPCCGEALHNDGEWEHENEFSESEG